MGPATADPGLRELAAGATRGSVGLVCVIRRRRPSIAMIRAVEDAWPELEREAEMARNRVEIHPARPEDGRRVLEALAVTTRSALGTFALHTAITLVDYGWVRLLGAGGQSTRCSLVGLDGEGLPLDPAVGVVVAYDVVGGFFAIDGGGLGGEHGEVRYLAPDTLEWEGTERGHGDWVRWMFAADLDDYYRELRWSGWRDEIAAVTTDQALSLYPPPFTQEGKDVSSVSRRAVPVRELWGFAQDFRRQLGIR